MDDMKIALDCTNSRLPPQMHGLAWPEVKGNSNEMPHASRPHPQCYHHHGFPLCQSNNQSVACSV